MMFIHQLPIPFFAAGIFRLGIRIIFLSHSGKEFGRHGRFELRCSPIIDRLAFRRCSHLDRRFQSRLERLTATTFRQPRTINGKQVFFQVFCPKIIVMRGRQMEPTTASRFIWCKVWAKLEGEEVEDFDGRDCEAFEQLRRKFTRWAADNAAALKTIKPTYPPRFNNRLQKNWRLLLAIAELAGGEWPKRARHAAVILTDRRAIEPSDGVRLLVSLDPLITEAIAEGRNWLTSEEIVTGLKANPDAEWREYRGKSPITERQIAWLLRQYDVYPGSIHPQGRANRCVRGYRLDQFNEPTRRFAHRYMAEVPPDPLITLIS